MTEANAALLRAKRIDEACDQFEAAWRAGKKPQIDAFLAKVSPAEQDALRIALLGVEKELKSQSAIDTSVSQSSVREPAGLASDRTAMFTPSKETPKQIGRFEIRGVLGAGAFGKIYRGYDAHLGRDVAIKVPLAAVVKNENDKDRFLKEARSAANINHPNVCQIYEVGEFENMPYIVMPVIPGQSLADAIKSKKEPLPEKQVAQIVRKIASAIAAAHDKGIIHRDLKPANVMFDKERKDMIVMDFGLARGPILGEARATQSGMILGTPAYMSPEQARGTSKDVGPGADIFSLGVILYELLTGVRPFSGTATEVIGQILHVEPKAPSAHRGGIDPQLENACRKAMAKNPEERFRSMREFVSAIDLYLKSANSNSTSGDTAKAVDTPKDAKELANEKDKLAEVFAAISAERKATARVVERAVAKSRVPPWVLVTLGALMLGGFLSLGAIIFFTRNEKVKVSIELTDVDLADKTLSFFLDDKPTSAEVLAQPVELSPGEHVFTAKRGQTIVHRILLTVAGGSEPRIAYRNITPPPPIAVAPTPAASEQDDLALWQGTWDCKVLLMGDKDLGAAELSRRRYTQTIQDITRTVKVHQPDGKVVTWTGKMRLDPSTNPKRFDVDYWSHDAGGGGFNNSGIYEFNGDRLRLIYREGPAGKELPRASWSDRGKVGTRYHEYVKVRSNIAEGWTELFNGKDLSNWRTPDGKPAEWKVQDGYMEVTPVPIPITADTLSQKAIVTEKDLPLDFELHAEFWLPNQPDKKDQARSNSGIYLLGRYEIQICDSYQNWIGDAKQACGALYNEIGVTEHANLPPETWQTFDITFQSPRFDASQTLTNPGRLTVVLNGKTVVKDAIVTSKETPGATNSNYGKPGPIQLQAHGSPVRFRNLRIRPLKTKNDTGFVPLFNGKDLSGWKNHPKEPGNWKVENGVLIGRGPERNDLYTERGDYTDFHFIVEARVNKGNGGQIFRAQQIVKGSPLGYEAIIDSVGHFRGNRTGSFYVLDGNVNSTEFGGSYIREGLVPANTWFTQEVIAQGDRVIIKVNGKVVTEVVDQKYRKGHLALRLWHADTVIEFRKIEIREFSDSATEKIENPVSIVTPVVTLRSNVPSDATTYGGHAYRFFAEQLAWKEAKAKCEALGGHLIVIDSAEENALAAKLIENAGLVDSWIGITDEAKEGDWRDVQGKPLGYTNWFTRQNQPNNKGAGEHFGLMSNKHLANGDWINWEWSDQPNEAQPQHRPGYLCEWDSKLADAESKANWIPLFNGKDLTGWDGDIAYWSVVDGQLIGKKLKRPIDEHTYLIASNPFANFELKVVATLIHGNSGVQVRSSKTPGTNFDMTGPQVEITGIDNLIWGTLIQAKGGERVQANLKDVRSVLREKDFNELLIRCEGKHITVRLNGAVVNDAEYQSTPSEGKIGLQLHKSGDDHEIYFKEIAIRPL